MKILTGLSATATLLLTGAVAGVFFAYSVSVMIGLDAVRPDQAIAVMRSVNDKIQNPLFLVTFLLTPAAAAATGVLLLVPGTVRRACCSWPRRRATSSGRSSRASRSTSR